MFFFQSLIKGNLIKERFLFFFNNCFLWTNVTLESSKEKSQRRHMFNQIHHIFSRVHFSRINVDIHVSYFGIVVCLVKKNRKYGIISTIYNQIAIEVRLLAI